MTPIITLETLTLEYWEAVRSIYLQGIATGNATFQQAAPAWEEWNESHLETCRTVAKENEVVVGWTALSPISKRPVYAGVAEISTYVAEAARGHGIGRQLLKKTITDSEANGIWTLQAGIFPENQASMRLHLVMGFRVVGTRVRVGKMSGRWRDVTLLERRSDVAGID
jgi:L-amino acid N-acyltransferase YncA